MKFIDRCKCCLGNPIAQFCGIVLGGLIGIQAIHMSAHYSMDVDVESYVNTFCRKNKEYCRRLVD